MTATIACLLPAPPLRLQPEFVASQRRRAGWAFAGVLVAGSYFFAYSVSAAIQLWRDHQVEAGPHVVAPAEWSGVQSSLRLWVDTVGRAYCLHEGRPVSLHLEFSTAVGFSTTAPLRVLFARDDRSRWTTNWSLEQFGNRCVAVASQAAMFGSCLGLAAGVLLHAVWSLRRARQVARHGTVGIGAVEGMLERAQKQGSTRIWRVRIDDESGSWRLRGRFPVGAGQPLHLPGGRVLVLVVRGQRVGLVLRQDLWPLKLRDDDVERVAAVLRELAPDAGWRTTATAKGTRLTCTPNVAVP